MAETADTVVLELEAKLDNYRRDVNQGANAFDQSVKRMASSASQAERSAGAALGAIATHSGSARAAQMELMHVTRSSVDQFAAGAPLMQIFAMHIAQVAQAFSMMGGSGGGGGGAAAASGAMDQLSEASGTVTEAVDKAKETSEKLTGVLGAQSAATEHDATATGTSSVARRENTVATEASAVATRTNTVAVEADAVAVEADAAATVVATGIKARFAAFLGGPWGIAVIAAITILGTLISKMFESGAETQKAGDKLKEHAKQSELAAQSAKVFAVSQEGVHDALLKAEEARKQATDGLKSYGEAANIAAKQNLELVDTHLQVAQALLMVRTAQLQASKNTTAGYALGTDVNAPHAQAVEQEINDLEASIAKMYADRARYQAELVASQTDLADEASKRIADKVEAIKRLYEGPNGLIQQAKAKAKAEGLVTAELTKQLGILREKEKSEVRAAQDAERDAHKKDVAGGSSFQLPVQGRITGQFNEQRATHKHAGIDIAVPVGTSVSAAAAGTVIEVGNMPGYGNVVVIDHGGGTTTRYAHLSKYLVSKGQTVGAGAAIALSGGAKGAEGAGNSQGPHVHYEVREGGKPVDPRKGYYATDQLAADNRAEALKKQAEAEQRRRDELADRRAKEEDKFQNELAGLNGDLLQARQNQVQTAGEAAQFEIEQIRIERDRKDAGYKDDAEAATRKDAVQAAIYAKHAEELQAANDRVAAAKTSVVQDRERQRLDEQRLQISLSDLRDRADVEQAAGALARTTAERRDSELRLLDYQVQEERLRLRLIESNTALDQSVRDQAKRAEAALDEKAGYARQGIMRQNLSPLDEFRDKIPKTAAEMNEALQSVAADGLTSLRDGLAQASSSWIKMGGIAGDTLRMVYSELMKLVFSKGFAQLLGMVGFGGKGLQSISSGSIAAMMPPSVTLPFPTLPGRASGGNVSPGHLYRVNEAGMEGFRPAGSGTIIPLGQMAQTGGGGGTTVINQVTVHANDAVLAETVRGWVAQGMQQAAVQGAIGGQSMTIDRLRRQQRRRLA